MAVVTMELVYMGIVQVVKESMDPVQVPTEYMVIVVIIVVCKAITVVEIMLF